MEIVIVPTPHTADKSPRGHHPQSRGVAVQRSHRRIRQRTARIGPRDRRIGRLPAPKTHGRPCLRIPGGPPVSSREEGYRNGAFGHRVSTALPWSHVPVATLLGTPYRCFARSHVKRRAFRMNLVAPDITNMQVSPLCTREPGAPESDAGTARKSHSGCWRTGGPARAFVCRALRPVVAHDTAAQASWVTIPKLRTDLRFSKRPATRYRITRNSGAWSAHFTGRQACDGQH